MEDYCGNCKFNKHNLCSKLDCAINDNDKACKLHEERYD